MTVELSERKGGVVLPVSAQPRARKNAIVGVHAGRLKVAVTQAPEKGAANTAILKVLAKELGLKPSQLSLASGAASRQKSIFVEGVTQSELSRRLAQFLPER